MRWLSLFLLMLVAACQNKPDAMLLKVAGEDKNCLLLVIQDDIVQVMRMQPCDGKPTKEEAK